MLFEPCGLRFPLQSFAGRVVVSTGLNRVGRFKARIAGGGGTTNKHKGPRYAPTLLRPSWCVFASLLTRRLIGGLGLAGKGKVAAGHTPAQARLLVRYLIGRCLTLPVRRHVTPAQSQALPQRRFGCDAGRSGLFRGLEGSIQPNARISPPNHPYRTIRPISVFPKCSLTSLPG